MMEAADLHYEIVIYWSDEDGAYIAEVLDLPGCMSDGLSYAEAAANSADAAQAWIETARDLGREVPAPTKRHAASA